MMAEGAEPFAIRKQPLKIDFTIPQEKSKIDDEELSREGIP
jgi:hypothetical protein